ncbi:MAG: hypothetical protein A2542_02680 [Parcubacteria group bacterium RIFOXYD2_FULL_52_8]|nr:MAG: hypothetical protein A2542_02680 [Parcubacteria group bacterium RIFOXYD2_FULL_52_8]
MGLKGVSTVVTHCTNPVDFFWHHILRAVADALATLTAVGVVAPTSVLPLDTRATVGTFLCFPWIHGENIVCIHVAKERTPDIANSF